MSLIDYIIAHTERGECKCGKCMDVGNKPDPSGHTADMIFFKVAAVGSPSADEFVSLANSHVGEFGDSSPFDGKEHSYMELGGWLGDQSLALMFMGLGWLLGVFDLRTPVTMLGLKSDDPLSLEIAGMGMVTVLLKQKQEAAELARMKS